MDLKNRSDGERAAYGHWFMWNTALIQKKDAENTMSQAERQVRRSLLSEDPEYIREAERLFGGEFWRIKNHERP